MNGMPNWRQNERPRDDLEKWCHDNWLKIPAEDRERCLAVLRKKAPPEMLAEWKAQHERGMRIGSNDLFFHFGIGMQVRNALREVLTDDKLPAIKQRDGSEGRNWDDFYTGALEDLVST